MSEQRPLKHSDVIRGILVREQDQRPLNALGVAQDDPGLLYAARRRFGSWRQALAAAGIDADEVGHYRRWNRFEIIQQMRRMSASGRSLRRRYLARRNPGLVAAAYKYFGSWRKALAAAGLDPEQFGAQTVWNSERIIEAILLRAVKREPLGSTTVRPASLKTAAVSEFGSWAAALESAGLDPQAHIGFAGRRSAPPVDGYRTRDDVRKALLQRHALGIANHYSAIRQQDRCLFEAIRTHFGSCAAALRDAGLTHADEISHANGVNKQKE